MIVSIPIPFTKLLNLSNTIQLDKALSRSQLDEAILDICLLLCRGLFPFLFLTSPRPTVESYRLLVPLSCLLVTYLK